MLIKPTREDGEKYLPFAYALALDPARSGYPTYTDGIKTKADFAEAFEKGFCSRHRGNLMYAENGKIAGWIQFTHLEEDAYLQTEIFNIAGDIRQALSEFMSYCQERYHGCTLYLGFPAENTEAVSYLSERGWERAEESLNGVLFLDSYRILPSDSRVVKVDRENFSDFRRLHSPVEAGMYWNSDRLYEDLEQWEIYLCYREGKPAGTIYYTDGDVLSEIFGVDFPEGQFDAEAFRSLLTEALNRCKGSGKKYMVFFHDDESQSITLDMGFTCVGRYVLHTGEV